MKFDIDTVAYMLYLDTWLDVDECVSDLGPDELKSLKDKWETGWLPALNEEHCGDCTKVCTTCIRCSVEQLYKDAKLIVEAS
jgi:hypothetical protein